VLVHEAWLKLVGPGGEDAPVVDAPVVDAPAVDEPAVDEPAFDVSPGERARWTGRRHFFALAARVMRHVLVNYAEQQGAAKRGGDAERVGLDVVEETTAAPVGPAEVDDVLALHAALQRLEARDPRQARIVECRFFAGLSIPETAEALDISSATVKREWAAARTWLHAELAASRDA
jgi:RNA polymerase sigma factor (TIGR02999 family)